MKAMNHSAQARVAFATCADANETVSAIVHYSHRHHPNDQSHCDRHHHRHRRHHHPNGHLHHHPNNPHLDDGRQDLSSDASSAVVCRHRVSTNSDASDLVI